MWPFDRKKKTEEIRADTVEVEKTTPEITSAEILAALLGKKTLSREEALQIPAVKGSIRLLSETIARLPIKLYERQSDGQITEVKDDPRLKLLNNETGDTLTASQFWRAIITDYFVGKGGYAYINKNGLDIISLHYVECEKISILKDPDPIFKDFKLNVYGKSYDPWDFFILLRNTRDGCRGVPIQEENTLILQVAYYSLVFESRGAQKGGAKKGFLGSEKQLTEEQIDSLKKSWRRLFEDNSENMMVLNKGLSFTDAQNNAREMQQNELRGTNFNEISLLFGIPGKIHTGGATEADYKTFLKHGLTSLLVDIEASLDGAFLWESEKDRKYFAFDTKELTRGSVKERFEAYEIASRNNFMQLDEIRQLEDLEPLGMNYLRLSLDTVLMDPDTKEVYTPNTGQAYSLNERMVKNESGAES